MRFSFDVESDSEAPEAAPQSPDQAPLSPAHAPVYLEYLAPSDDDLEPAEAQPLPASVSPTVLSPDYLADFEPVEEDLEEDPGEDHEEDPKDDPSEEEDELSAPTDSPPVRLYIDLPFEGTDVGPTSDPLSPANDAFVDSWVAAPAPPLPPPSLLSPLSSPLPMIPSPPLLLPPPIHRDIIPEADMPPRKRARFGALSHRFKIGENSAAVAARQPGSALTKGTEFGFVTSLEESRRPRTLDRLGLTPWIVSVGCRLRSEYCSNRGEMMLTADALATYDTNRSNGNDSHDLGSGRRRTVHTTRECTYSDFLKCQPLNFKGTEGAVGLAQWFEKMESVFHISNCTVGCQVKFATCTLLGSALTCEIKKLETELWNLVVKGTHVESYTQCFQELILLCLRMVPDESDKVEKYTGGLPDSIQGSVMASKPKTLQEAIELTRSFMDQKLLTYVARQTENKRKMDNNSRNNHA
ncbi:hypothetical protein Tco_1199067 [Tanacetum coccineum]